MTDFLSYLILGLTRGSTYALIALGYTLVYGVLQLINFAHSEVFMSGAFGSFLIVHLIVGSGKGTRHLGGAVRHHRRHARRRPHRGRRSPGCSSGSPIDRCEDEAHRSWPS